MNAFQSNREDLDRLRRKVAEAAMEAALHPTPYGAAYKRLDEAYNRAQSEYEQLVEYCHLANRLSHATFSASQQRNSRQ